MESNDAIRQRFIDRTVPQADFIGLTIPDKDMKLDEKTGSYAHGPINWDEFFEVIKGNGPCNKERIAVRKWSEEHGRWVRNALQKAVENIKDSGRRNAENLKRRGDA